eukprot:TRINITY_DN11268_c0_g1_i1.p1 TRINITY_DN11268_c0_g1~~TRINITY_DN11268_c0_g1_i1.p1  ORF type:complete len:259 (-),score=14.05 TRINITY_DN11268_c0_g1_i1:60-836(-)
MISNSTLLMENHHITRALSKFTCIDWIYPFHLGTAYILTLFGILALLSRIVPKLTPYHATFGRLFLLFMYYCMGSSLLMFNTGLSLAITIFFIVMLVGITVGWFAIRKHITDMNEKLFYRVGKYLKNKNKPFKGKLDVLFNNERIQILSERSFCQTLFSWKTLHGVCMGIAWFQMAGRVMATNPVENWHGCWARPAYVNEFGELTLVPEVDPSGKFTRTQPGLFVLAILLPLTIITLTIAIVSSYLTSRKANKTLLTS